MISLLLTALVPVAFVVLLGFYAGRKGLVSEDGARNFSAYIVDFALPCTLFVGVFSFTPAQFTNVPYLATITLALVVPFVVGLGIAMFGYKKSRPESGLFACNCGFPDMAYFGLPVLMTVVGAQGLLPVIVGNLVTSILLVPCIVLLLNHKASGNDASPSLLSSLLGTVKQPVVWAPVLGLVVFAFALTTAAVALVARALVPALPWPAAIALCAIVAPPDAVAASAVLRRINPPHRVLTVLEGESLFNDATALLIFRVAVQAAGADGFTLASVAPTFLLGTVGSLVAGPALGWLATRLFERIEHVPTAVILQFVTTFGVWLLAERLGMSGALTMVCYAITVAQRSPERTPARVRIPRSPVLSQPSTITGFTGVTGVTGSALPRYPAISVGPTMRISPSPPGATFTFVAGSNRRTCCPASAVPMVPIFRRPGGFMVDAQVASDSPYETTSGTPNASSTCWCNSGVMGADPQRRKRSDGKRSPGRRCGSSRANIVSTAVMYVGASRRSASSVASGLKRPSRMTLAPASSRTMTWLLMPLV